jgi:hypothetical protein
MRVKIPVERTMLKNLLILLLAQTANNRVNPIKCAHIADFMRDALLLLQKKNNFIL